MLKDIINAVFQAEHNDAQHIADWCANKENEKLAADSLSIIIHELRKIGFSFYDDKKTSLYIPELASRMDYSSTPYTVEFMAKLPCDETTFHTMLKDIPHSVMYTEEHLCGLLLRSYALVAASRLASLTNTTLVMEIIVNILCPAPPAIIELLVASHIISRSIHVDQDNNTTTTIFTTHNKDPQAARDILLPSQEKLH